MKLKIQELNDEVKELRKKYNVELVAVETIERLLHDLNNDHVKSSAYDQ